MEMWYLIICRWSAVFNCLQNRLFYSHFFVSKNLNILHCHKKIISYPFLPVVIIKIHFTGLAWSPWCSKIAKKKVKLELFCNYSTKNHRSPLFFFFLFFRKLKKGKKRKKRTKKGKFDKFFKKFAKFKKKF